MMLENYDPLIIFNDKISTVHDRIQHETNQTRIFLNALFNQTLQESKTRKKYCEICLVRHVSFEGHHVAGRKHDHRQITACIPCHNILTGTQKLWDSRWWDETESEVLRLSFLYHGVYDVLKLISAKRQDSLYSQIADSIIPMVSYLQNGAQN
ncbi:hypothetical protein C6990_09600 [Nitrosopumilus sp. b3]|uniref:hypothetical protein n=1 Tax=Nitrosopumilus sp. b3 TaxID=2109909 RepID=UPI0015F6F3B0|nr:hypothetical protein [Nitrosopumilus sp. b3]KAF6246371.1 hypothetical protein C6990_09600 [Nitrosopumilus sp. b3]